MRWRRAIVAAVVGAVASGIVYPFVIHPLWDFARFVLDTTSLGTQVGGVATTVTIGVLTLPGLFIALLVYGLGKPPKHGHTHCGNCGYMLKGLTELRCPECGERI